MASTPSGNGSEYAVEMLHINKNFGSLRALDDVTLRVKYGEVHAILGENGAGKSTLMSVLFGLKHADSGIIRVDGKEVKIKSPNDATRLGIGMVHQHFKLVDVFSVLDNIVLGHETHTLGFINKKKEREQVQAIVDRFDLNLDLKAKIKDLSVASQQKVEIAKVLYLSANIIILDEPTAVLTPQEIQTLMEIIRGFAKQGKAVIIITHKLNEIKQVADKVSILRRGKYLGTFNVADCSPEQLAEVMVGKKVNFEIEKADIQTGDPVLEISNLSCDRKDRSKKALNDINLTVHSGEVAAIAAIEGNGQEELINLVTGLEKYPKLSGKITFHGKTSTFNMLDVSVKTRIKEGMSDIPADRQKHGLILDYDIKQNLISKSLKNFSRFGFLRFGKIAENGRTVSEKYDIRSSAGIATKTGDMSGGNQQKVIIGRELELQPKLLISDQATRGLDVGAIEFVNKRIIEARDSGAAVLLYSTELEDIFNLATVIYVMYDGRITAKLDPKKATSTEIGLFMSGGAVQDENGNTVVLKQETVEEKAEEEFAQAVESETAQPTEVASEAEKPSEVENKPIENTESEKKPEFCIRSRSPLAARHRELALKLNLPEIYDSVHAVEESPAEEKINEIVPADTQTAASENVSESEDRCDDIAETIQKDRLENKTESFASSSSAGEESKSSKQRTSLLNFFKKHQNGPIAFLDSVVAVLIGCVLGFIVMLCINPENAVAGFGLLFTSAFRRTSTIGSTLRKAAPLIVVGLAIAVPYKAGLFNIGASGQFTFAGLASLLILNQLPKSMWDQSWLFLLALILCIVAGACYAAIPGLLKAFFNVNEVLSGIMLNWIAVFMCMVLTPMIWDANNASANFTIPGAFVPSFGLDKVFGSTSHLDIGIIMAVVIAVIIFIVVTMTKYGYKLRACGLSSSASKYSGYNAKSYIVSSMIIAGAMAGFAALFTFFSEAPLDYINGASSVKQTGFDGISVAMIANCNPAGCIVSALLLSVLEQANNTLQPLGYEGNIVNVIMGVVIYSSAAAKIIAILVRKYKVKAELKREAKQKLSLEGGK